MRFIDNFKYHITTRNATIAEQFTPKIELYENKTWEVTCKYAKEPIQKQLTNLLQRSKFQQQNSESKTWEVTS